MIPTLIPGDASDQALLSQVRPADWIDPTPAPRYNLVVVGAGTAGLVCAAGAAGLGARVALVERALLGGDCLNVGCVPSKALLRSARAAASLRHLGELGVQSAGEPRVDFAAVMARLRRLRASLAPHDSAARFRSLGVDVFLGAGHFTGPESLEVNGKSLRFTRAVIATGARAHLPDVPGLREAGCLTNENVFALTELPARLLVVGAGPIGCELAQAFARLGSRVTLLTRDQGILPREDADASAQVLAALQADGVTFLPGAELVQVASEGSDKRLRVRIAGEVRELEGDAILIGAGRRPNVDGLGLEAAKVTFDTKTGVHVDDRLRTTNARIYAAGDVCSRYQFTHAADAMARIVLHNALFLGGSRVSALTIPWCTYTEPELARVGLSETEAREQGIAVDVFVQEMSKIDRAVLDAESAGFVRVLVRRGTDRIVGATIVGSHAGELVGTVSLAMIQRIGLGRLARTVYPYPTQTEAIRKVADAYQRTRLTPWTKWFLGRWLAWWR